MVNKLTNAPTVNQQIDKINEIIDNLGGGSSTSSRNIGEIVTSTIPLTDADLHLLDGSLISGSGSYSAFVDYIADLITDYPDLFVTEANWQTSVTQHGVCGKFVYDSVNNTVRLPKITSIIEGTTDVTALGDLIEAGLPKTSISVPTTGSGNNNTQWHRAELISNGGSLSRGGLNNDNWQIQTLETNTSSIYGNSNTVQPQAIKVLYYIVIATSTKTAIQVDIDEIATDLNGKADVDFTNVDNQGKILMSEMGLPSETYYDDLTVGSTGTQYTAPSNGWVHFGGKTSANYQYVNVNVSGGTSVTSSMGKGLIASCTIPVLKGQTFTIWYSVTSQIVLKFFYAVGSESEA